jgi:hypothetical protein
MPESIRLQPRSRPAPAAPAAGRAWPRRLGMAVAALLSFAILVGALTGVVGDLAIATMLAGIAAITAAPFLGSSGGGRAS